MRRCKRPKGLATPQKLVITNPKRGSAPLVGRDQWFPYYAGFSSEFAKNIVSSSSLTKGAKVMDPWNGSGTTTFSAVLNGYKGIGFDLNPVMAVVAKARLLPQSEIASVLPLLAEILKKAALTENTLFEDDPLEIWLAPEAAVAVRRIERAIYDLLVSSSENGTCFDATSGMSCLATFFYVALFRAVRSILQRFNGSNPTWIVRPSTTKSRSRPPAWRVRECFAGQVDEMVSGSLAMPKTWGNRAAAFRIGLASSESLPVQPESIDLILSSPPYCTRIDYGIATLVELAVMGFEVESRLRELRAGLIGTPTIHPDTPTPHASWGKTCIRLLDQVRDHPSKAAKSYYYKTYVQYFAAIARSLKELGRCLKPGGRCVLVVQDSYFKDVHVDLPGIFVEMAVPSSLRLQGRTDFPIRRTFGSINAASRNYRRTSSATESVLCFGRCT